MKQVKRIRRTLVQIGRDVANQTQEENLKAKSEFTIGQPVQYHDEGLRFGHVREISSRGKHKGEIRVEHPITHRLKWIEARYVIALGADNAN